MFMMKTTNYFKLTYLKLTESLSISGILIAIKKVKFLIKKKILLKFVHGQKIEVNSLLKPTNVLIKKAKLRNM